jgi:hypothetical protein
VFRPRPEDDRTPLEWLDRYADETHLLGAEKARLEQQKRELE